MSKVSSRQTHGLARFALFAIGFAQAFMRTGGATAAVAGNAKLTTQILQRAGATLGGFTNLAIRHGLANANVHGWTPLL